MTSTIHTSGKFKALQILFAVLVLASFFLPWVNWDGNLISGYSMPVGDFFGTSETKFGLANPFPQFNFAFNIFWLVPLLAVLVIAFVLVKKKAALLSFIAGALSLSLVTVYILFTNTLLDLGVGKELTAMLKPAIYLQALGAAGLILTAFPVKNVGAKIVWLVLGPLLAFGSYKMGERYIMNETHTATENVKADYTVNASDLIREFVINDTAANSKYREKILTVNGKASAVEIKLDSTVNIKFIDTTRHFLNFSIDKEYYKESKNIKAGDIISLKGSCSGSDYSMILDSTSINFKRVTLNKK